MAENQISLFKLRDLEIDIQNIHFICFYFIFLFYFESTYSTFGLQAFFEQ